jgi:hypothetical protein
MQLKVELNASYAWAEKLTPKECNVIKNESQNLIKDSTLDQAKIKGFAKSDRTKGWGDRKTESTTWLSDRCSVLV